MKAEEIKFNGRYVLRADALLGREIDQVVRVVERRGAEFFVVRDAADRLLTESVHCSDLSPSTARRIP